MHNLLNELAQEGEVGDWPIAVKCIQIVLYRGVVTTAVFMQRGNRLSHSAFPNPPMKMYFIDK